MRHFYDDEEEGSEKPERVPAHYSLDISGKIEYDRRVHEEDDSDNECGSDSDCECKEDLEQELMDAVLKGDWQGFLEEYSQFKVSNVHTRVRKVSREEYTLSFMIAWESLAMDEDAFETMEKQLRREFLIGHTKMDYLDMPKDLPCYMDLAFAELKVEK